MKKSKSYLSKPSTKDLANSLPLYSIIFIIGFIFFLAIFTLEPSNVSDGKFLGFSSYSRSLNNEWLTFTVANVEYENSLFMLLPFLLGLSQFMFLHYKNKSYSTFSFPLSRKTIFNNRVVLPFVLIVIATLIIKIIALDQNVMIFGFSFRLFLYWIIHIFRILSVALLSYSTAIVFSILCGRYLEAAIAGLSLHLFPMVFILFVGKVTETTLYGVSGSVAFASADEFFRSGYVFASDSLCQFNCYKGIGTFYLFDYISTYIPLLYIAISIVALVIIKRYFVKSYKAEICGFKGVSKLANFIICLTPVTFAGFYAISITYHQIFVIPPRKLLPVVYIASILVMLLVAYICGLLIHFSFKKAKGTLISGVAMSVVLILFSVFFATDMFGIFNKLPEEDEIKEIMLVPSDRNEASTNMGILNGPVYKLNSPEDIRKCLEFNEAIIKNRRENVGQSVGVYFELKNGEMVHRTYHYLDTASSKASLEMWNTDAVKADIEKQLFPDNYLTENGKKVNCNYEESRVVMFSQYHARTTNKLDKAQLDFLRTAVLKDNRNLSVNDKYFPNSQYLGTLNFTIHLNEAAEINAGYATTVTYYNTPVYENSTETIKALKQLKLYDKLFKEQKILNAYIVDLNVLRNEIKKSEYISAPNPIYYDAGMVAKSQIDLSICDQILDPNKIDSLISESQRYYYTESSDMDALLMEYEQNTDDYIIYFLPKNN